MKKFQFSYSSFPSFFTEVTLEGNILEFKENYSDSAVKKELSDKKIEAFWKMIKPIRLEYWKENYSACVLDGLQWNLIIDTDFLVKEISGVNEYPDGSCTLRKTPIFDRLIAAVEYIIDKPGFYKSLK